MALPETSHGGQVPSSHPRFSHIPSPAAFGTADPHPPAQPLEGRSGTKDGHSCWGSSSPRSLPGTHLPVTPLHPAPLPPVEPPSFWTTAESSCYARKSPPASIVGAIGYSRGETQDFKANLRKGRGLGFPFASTFGPWCFPVWPSLHVMVCLSFLGWLWVAVNYFSKSTDLPVLSLGHLYIPSPRHRSKGPRFWSQFLPTV